MSKGNEMKSFLKEHFEFDKVILFLFTKHFYKIEDVLAKTQLNRYMKCSCINDCNPSKMHPVQLCKVVSLLEACFDLISSPSPSMKIQIMGGKITENLRFKSPLRKVKNFFFFLFSNSSQKTGYL